MYWKLFYFKCPPHGGVLVLTILVLLCGVSAVEVVHRGKIEIVQLPKSVWGNPDAFHIAYVNLTRHGKVLHALPRHRYMVYYRDAETPELENVDDVLYADAPQRRNLQGAPHSMSNVILFSSPYYFIRQEVEEFLLVKLRLARRSGSFVVQKEGDAVYAVVFKPGIDLSIVQTTISFLQKNPRVAWVHRASKYDSHNHNALPLMLGGDKWNKFVSDNLRSSAQVVTVLDTGVDVSHCYWGKQSSINYLTYDIDNIGDLRRRIVALAQKKDKILVYMRILFRNGFETETTDFVDKLHGHGTHTSASAVGPSVTHTCFSQNSSVILPTRISDARLFFVDVSNDAKSSGGGLTLPYSISTMLELSYASGSRIASNSWGAPYNYYSFNAHEYDAFIYEHRDYFVLFSAGNNGDDGYGTVSAPCIAKNVLCVGASSNTVRAFDDFSRFSWYANDYTHSTIPDAMDVKNRGYLYMEDNLMEFSSTGPAYDGRIKPDVVGVGAPVLSACAGCGDYCLCAKQGTSMSCPLVAALAVALRDYLLLKYNVEPSAALMIALFISSAQLLDARVVLHAFDPLYRYSAYVSKVYPTPFSQPTLLNMYQQGWGRANLAGVFEGRFDFKDNLRMAAYSQPHVYTFRATEDDLQAVVSIVWIDPPGAVENDFALVNDLNLRVILFKEEDVVAVLHGNSQAVPDILNTREKIIVDVRAGDVLRVVVSARGPIVHMTQEYSLVYSLSLVPINKTSVSGECSLWDPEYECISRDQEGLIACENGMYNRTECLLRPSNVSSCAEGEVFSVARNRCLCTNHIPCAANETDSFGVLHRAHFAMCDPVSLRLNSTCTNELVTVFADMRNRTSSAIRRMHGVQQHESVLSLNENRQPYDVTVWVALFAGAWLLGIIIFFISSRIVVSPS